MVNKFLCVGNLHECIISFYATHVKIRLSLDINNQSITFSQTISHKWQKDRCDEICRMIPYLHPRIDGMITKNGKEQIYTMRQDDKPTKLLISGNINEWRGNIYFNSQYMRIVDANAADNINIEVSGQWADKNRFINICGDWPREFHINAPNGCEKRIYMLNLIYSGGYMVHDGVVDISPYGLQIVDFKPLDKYISDEQMDKILLELEIMN